MPEAEHTKWKYLAHLDGYAASYRFSMLLHANSVVLKQACPRLTCRIADLM